MLGILAAIGTVVGVATAWGIYPVGVIVLLAVALVGALWVAWLGHRRDHDAATTAPPGPDAAARHHDARIVAEVRNLVTRPNIEWLRTWDFGGSWRDSSVRPLRELNYLDDVEHRPIDPDLAASLRRFFDANREFTGLLTQHSFPERGGGDERWRNVGWSGSEADSLEGDERRLWEQRRDLLNDGADPVAEAYDEFIEVARRQLLLDVLEAEG
ncbi:MAG TPA: hypothetical protein VFM74_01825 [Candidatus Limnocylindria bacterium]|nr:hypothetical protein [Candidatus Limnocylindria bacterium]